MFRHVAVIDRRSCVEGTLFKHLEFQIITTIDNKMTVLAQ